MSGEDKMKPLLSNLALYQNLTSRVFAASSAASRVHPSLLGVKTANVTHPSLLPSVAIGGGGAQAAAIHTTPSFNAEKVLAEVKSNPYFDKYKSKIAKSADAADGETLARKVVEARQKYAEEEPEEVKAIRDKLNILEESSQSPVKLSKKDRPALDDIVKLDLLRDKSAEEIRHIWLEYHKAGAKNVVSAVAPPPALRAMMSEAENNPQFLFVVPRGGGGAGPTGEGSGGMEFVLGQWKKTDIYFTPLIQYQTHGENAPVALTVHHFDELAESNDVVLMRGEFDPNVFSPIDAQVLVMQMQQYYGENATPAKRKLLHTFNHQPKYFKHMDVVAQLDWI